MVEYEVANRDSDQPVPIRLITTVLDPAEVTAAELAAASHCRWEFATSLAEIETCRRGSYRLLRSQSPAMALQEIWGLLTTHYAVGELMHHAADLDGSDPLRLSFIRALRVVRRHVTGQEGLSP